MIKFANLKLKNPLMPASGCYGYGWEADDASLWGAVITKTISLNAREGNPPPRIFEADGGVINRVGLQNCGLDFFIKEHLPRLIRLGTKFIVSIFGNDLGEWEALVKRLTSKGVEALELNLSCPNLKGEVLLKDPDYCFRMIGSVRDLTRGSLIAKINAVDGPVELAKGMAERGIDGIVCSNSIPSAVNFEGTIYNGGLTGPVIKPIVLKAVHEIRKAVGTDIGACGGIRCTRDITDYRNAGAKVFVVGSVLLTEPGILKELIWQR